ncbi:MAG: hypothetical protein AAGB00_02335 [Planctomycetota bacterium]
MLRNLLTVGLCWCALVAPALAQLPPIVPLGGLFKPDSGDNPLVGYNLASDPDAPFGAASRGLAPRTFNPALQANPNARGNQGQVMILAAVGNASAQRVQGSQSEAEAYAFTHWQYIDTYVHWGGSAGEGNILVPPSHIVDAGHRNGVKVFGNIFLPPNVFGGTQQVIDDFLQQDAGGNFPVADRLIELAETQGYDGYFLNQETNVSPATVGAFYDFLTYFQENTDKELVWYDAMNEAGGVGYQGGLNQNNNAFLELQRQPGVTERTADSFFADFRWTDSRLNTSVATAEQRGRSGLEVFAGVNVRGNNAYEGPANFNGRTNASDFDRIFPRGQDHRLSVGLFQPVWTLRTVPDSGTTLERLAEYHNREQNFWVGGSGDPRDDTDTIGNGWGGVADYIAARSPVAGDEFVTNFSVGQGVGYYVDGVLSRHGEWNNVGVQDVLPTWRWIIDSTSSNTLQPEYDFTDAYYGGNSVRVSGVLDGENTLRLYAGQLNLHADSRFEIALKTGVANDPTHASVLLAFDDDPTNFTAVLPYGDTATADWGLKSLDLSAFAGRTVSQIGLRFDDADDPDFDLNVGRLGVVRDSLMAPAAPTNASLQESAANGDGFALRLLWDHSADHSRDQNNGVYQYNAFRRNPDGSRTFLGATGNNALYVEQFTLLPEDANVLIDIEAVGPGFRVSSPLTLAINRSAVQVLPPLNLLANGDFELSDAGTPPAPVGWFGSATGAAYVLDDDSDGVGERSVALQTDGEPSADWRASAFSFAGGQDSLFAFDHRFLAGATGQVKAFLRYFSDASGTAFLSQEVFTFDASNPNEWQSLAVWLTSPAGAASADVWFTTAFADFAGEWRLDNAAIYASTDLTPGDYNLDGLVTTADYLLWRESYGSADARADGNRDGLVDAADYTVWRDAFAAFTTGIAPGLAAQGAPEPTALSLGLLAVVSLPGVVRRSRSGKANEDRPSFGQWPPSA